MELRLIEEQRDKQDNTEIVDILLLIEARTKRTPDLPTDIILLTRLHESFLNDIPELKRHLALIAYEAGIPKMSRIFTPHLVEFLRVAQNCFLIIPLSR